MLKIENVGWIEKEKPKIGPYDAIVKLIVIAPCALEVQNEFYKHSGEMFTGWEFSSIKDAEMVHMIWL